MNRPKVVVRAVASVDGRVISAPCAGEEWLRFTHEPEAVLLDGSGLPGGDDWEPWPLPPFEGDPQPLYQDFLPDAIVHRPEHRGWFTVEDSQGRQRWAFKEDEGHWHLLVVTAHRTPPEYLAYLRRENIPYLVAGEEGPDFRLAIEKLGSLLGVTCVLSTAGGELGGALLRAGVVDEVNVEFSSTVKGSRETVLLFDAPESGPTESPTRLELASVQVQAGGRVWHRYQVPREGEEPAGETLTAEQPVVSPARPRAAEEEPAPGSRITLPQPDTRGTMPLEMAIARRRSIRCHTAQDLSLEQIGQLLWAAQGITEPEKGLRAAPSAGARYPLAFYACRADGVWRYQPKGHALSRHLEQDVRYGLAEATFDASWLVETPCVFAVSFVSERVCLSYGEELGWTRSLPMDCGHAAQNLLLQAVALGLGSVPLDAFDVIAVKEVLALPEGEGPLYLLPVGYPA